MIVHLKIADQVKRAGAHQDLADRYLLIAQKNGGQHPRAQRPTALGDANRHLKNTQHPDKYQAPTTSEDYDPKS
jgi:hypothetical protein